MTVEPLRFSGSDTRSELLLYPIGNAAGRTEVAEGATYKFRLRCAGDIENLQPSELFEIDPDDPKMGRFRPANHVGTIIVSVRAPDAEVIQFDVDVRPAKLGDEGEYRSLLEQVADYAAEAVLQGFAPSTRQVAATTDEIGDLSYRSLAFVAARLRDERFLAAVEQILRKPHRRWISVTERSPIARGAAAGSGLSRQFSRPGTRTGVVPVGLRHLGLAGVPSTVDRSRNEVTHDTNPNRFIRFVFRHWLGLALNLERSLTGPNKVGAGPQSRGLTEARWIIGECERVLTSPALAEVGDLRSFPHGDPVLLRQAGYREVLRVFALAEASMALDATLDDDIFSATQRNIATLYEYWCFLVLVRCVTRICGDPVAGSLFAPSAIGLSLVLREGSESLMRWEHELDGRRLSIDLWFNQTFRRAQADGVEIGSWASSIRPDASMRIRPITGRPRDAVDPHLDTWIHFDAKFRLDIVGSEMSDDDPKSTAKRTDLLKMHAYRDLIRRSAGAYVLYPGFGPGQRRREFHEVLPGIGAFPLRPAPDGEVSGADGLAGFLRETLELTANQASGNERAQFWRREHTQRSGRSVQAVSFLTSPPADESVLIGYVRREQLPWVVSQRRYNVRGDGRRGSVAATDSILAARLVLLWTHAEDGEEQVVGLFERTGPWQIASAYDLEADGYPIRPVSGTYLVTGINPVTSIVESLVAPTPALPLPSDMAPVESTWEEVARSSSG